VLRILLADDEDLIRAGLRTVLADTGEVDVVAEAGDGRSAVELAVAHRPDVALLDVAMPVVDGLEALREIRRVSPATQVLMLTSFGTEENVVEALDGGAAGFVLKTSSPAELLIAVIAAHRGQAYLSPEVTRLLITRITARPRSSSGTAVPELLRLTPKERQVADRVARGFSNREIGHDLTMTEASAKTYVSRVMNKLGCTNRVQLALLVKESLDA